MNNLHYPSSASNIFDSLPLHFYIHTSHLVVPSSSSHMPVIHRSSEAMNTGREARLRHVETADKEAEEE